MLLRRLCADTSPSYRTHQVKVGLLVVLRLRLAGAGAQHTGAQQCLAGARQRRGRAILDGGTRRGTAAYATAAGATAANVAAAAAHGRTLRAAAAPTAVRSAAYGCRAEAAAAAATTATNGAAVRAAAVRRRAAGRRRRARRVAVDDVLLLRLLLLLVVLLLRRLRMRGRAPGVALLLRLRGRRLRVLLLLGRRRLVLLLLAGWLRNGRRFLRGNDRGVVPGLRTLGERRGPQHGAGLVKKMAAHSKIGTSRAPRQTEGALLDGRCVAPLLPAQRSPPHAPLARTLTGAASSTDRSWMSVALNWMYAYTTSLGGMGRSTTRFSVPNKRTAGGRGRGAWWRQAGVSAKGA
jgi:hypothetical protein